MTDADSTAGHSGPFDSAPLRSGRPERSGRTHLRLGLLARIHLALWTLYFGVFWYRAFRYDEAGNLVAGHPHLWADWAIHFTFGTTMAYREPIPLSSPLLLGERLAYPFASDLLSALLVKAGVPLVSAFVLPSLVFSLLLVLALFAFLRTLFRSEAVAVVGSWIFLCGGGAGFVAFIRDVATSAHPLLTLLGPAHDYTRLEGTSIVLLSVIEGMIVPQRSFTHGFPLALLALALVHSELGRRDPSGPARPRWARLVVAALVLGLLPIVHAHTFLSVFVILACWTIGDVFFGEGVESPQRGEEQVDSPSPQRGEGGVRGGNALDRAKPWALVAAVTAALALPLIRVFLSSHLGDGFVRWFPGWYAKELQVGWVRFWLDNWSVTPLLAVAGLVLLVRRGETTKARLHTLFLFLPFFVLFLLVNLFLFAPWLFDNTKLLAAAAVGFSGLAAQALVELWGWRRAVWSARVAAALLFLCATTAGAVDAWRMLTVERQGNVMYTAEELKLADWARTQTPVRSVWLTGDQHNHWLTNLTGRQTVMAYRGWLWSQGYRYEQAERDVGRMFESADAALLARYGIDYVVVGPQERGSWHASERTFARYPIVVRTRSYTVFRVR